MKKTAAFVLILAAAFSLYAGSYNDLSFTFGHQSGGIKNADGLNMMYGFNLGLSGRMEMGLWTESMLTPCFFSDNAVGLSFSFALLGPRSTGTSVPGSAINMFVNAGMMFTMHNPHDLFLPTTAYISITPLSIGSSVLGRRERFMEMGAAYNWFENEFIFFFSFLRLDYFITGTWRDYL